MSYQLHVLFYPDNKFSLETYRHIRRLNRIGKLQSLFPTLKGKIVGIRVKGRETKPRVIFHMSDETYLDFREEANKLGYESLNKYVITTVWKYINRTEKENGTGELHL